MGTPEKPGGPPGRGPLYGRVPGVPPDPPPFFGPPPPQFPCVGRSGYYIQGAKGTTWGPFVVGADPSDGLVLFLGLGSSSTIVATDQYGSIYKTWPVSFINASPSLLYMVYCANVLGSNPRITLTLGTSRAGLVQWVEIEGANDDWFIDGVAGVTAQSSPVTPSIRTQSPGDLILCGAFWKTGTAGENKGSISAGYAIRDCRYFVNIPDSSNNCVLATGYSTSAFPGANVYGPTYTGGTGVSASGMAAITVTIRTGKNAPDHAPLKPSQRQFPPWMPRVSPPPQGFAVPVSTGPRTGNAAITEAPDVLAATGQTTAHGTAAITESLDTVAATGTVKIHTGTLALTQAPETILAAGSATAHGTLTKTQAGQTIGATGHATAHGTAAVTQAGQTLAGTGHATAHGALTQTQTAETVAATGTVSAPGAITGTAAMTQAAESIAAAGHATAHGAAAVSQAGQGLTSAGHSVAHGGLSVALAGTTLAGTGHSTAHGSLTATQDNNVLRGGYHVAVPEVGTGEGAAEAYYHARRRRKPASTGRAWIDQADQALIARGTVRDGFAKQADQGLAAKGCALIGGRCSTRNVAQKCRARGRVLIKGRAKIRQRNSWPYMVGKVTTHAQLAVKVGDARASGAGIVDWRDFIAREDDALARGSWMLDLFEE